MYMKFELGNGTGPNRVIIQIELEKRVEIVRGSGRMWLSYLCVCHCFGTVFGQQSLETADCL